MNLLSTLLIVAPINAQQSRRPKFKGEKMFAPSGEWKCANRPEGNKCCPGREDDCVGFNSSGMTTGGYCLCDEACMGFGDCCDDHQTACLHFHDGTGPTEAPAPSITNIEEMASHILDGTGNGGFISADSFNYGCAGRELYQPHSPTLGKQVDEVDKAFYTWKKCVQCALKHYNTKLEDISYDYDAELNSCGKICVSNLNIFLVS